MADNHQESIKKYVPFAPQPVKDYLDDSIRRWQGIKVKAESEKKPYMVTMADHYIGAFQDVRLSLFGEMLEQD